MPPIVALALIGVGAWAFRTCYLHVTGKLRESRRERIDERVRQLAPKQMSPVQRRMTAARHDTGWWLREIFTGFPVAWHGWHAGWLAHSAAAEQQRAIADEHRSIRDSFRAARAQGQKNLQLIEKADEEAAAAGEPPLTRAQIKDRLKAASPPAQPRQEDGEVAARAAHPAALPPPEPAAAGADDTPAAAVPPQAPAVPAVPAQGEPMPTQATAETTYSQDIDKFSKTIIACDFELARLHAEQMMAHVEMMVASGMNPEHTGMANDLAQSIERQIKATKETHDQAVALKNALIRTDSAGHDYHSARPGGGASREYLRD